MAVSGTGSAHKGRAVRANRRVVHIGAEHGKIVVPGQLAPAMRPQVHDRRPAAGHRNRVTGDFFQHSAFAGLRADRDAGDPLAPLHLGHAVAHHHADAQRLGLGQQRAVGGQHARIHDDRHVKARLFHSDCSAIGIVIVGHDRNAVARAYAIVHNVIAHGAGQHDAGDIIARKAERAFDRARGRDHVLCLDPPQPVAWAGLVRGVVGQTLVPQHIAVVIHPCAHGTQAHGHIRHRGQVGHHLIHDLIHRLVVHRAAIHGRAPAHMGVLFENQHLGPGLSRRFCGHEARNAGPDHQHIAEGVEVFVGVRVAALGRLPQTCGLPNERLVNVFPQGTRVDEHLVVKARRHKARQLGVQRAHVKFEAGPVVLAGGQQPVEQLGRGGALVRLELALDTKVHQRVGLFDTRGDNAAGAVVLERSAHQHLVVGQQRRGKRVTRIALHHLAIEGEPHGAVGVDQAATCGQSRAHDFTSSLGQASEPPAVVFWVRRNIRRDLPKTIRGVFPKWCREAPVAGSGSGPDRCQRPRA